MTNRPIVARVGAADHAEDALKEAFSRWASGVCIVAARVDGRIAALTATAFTPLSLRPPLVLVSLGGNARVLPFLDAGARFAISVLGGDQRRIATVFSDSGPLGRDAFEPEGDAIIKGAIMALACTVHAIHPAGDHRLVIGQVQEITIGSDEPALLYFRRQYGRTP
jgi:flavin reductase (NADH)